MEYVTLTISFFSLAVSSVLVILKLQEYRPNLKIYLEWHALSKKCLLVLVNKGKKPITITEIFAKSPDRKRAHYPVLEDNQEDILPMLLSFGEPAIFILTNEIARRVVLRDADVELDLFIYDSNNNEYVPTRKRELNPRNHGHSKFVKLERAKHKGH